MATASEPWRPGAPARPGGAAKAPTSAIDGAALVTRLRELAASPELPLDALEQSLRAVVEACGAGAAAICLYDTRQEMLRLAAEHGLSDEGCRRLRTVRRGDAASWDMPLHGLLNRRAYLIDSAARNRYVPPLVEDSSTVRTIACLPLLQGNTAQGSLVLVMVAPSALREEDIRALDQPLRELARLIDVVRRQVSGEAVKSREIASGAPAPAGPAEVPGDAAAPDQADSGRIAALTIALTAARREKARLESDLQRLRSEAARQDPRLADLTAEVDRLRTRLAEAEAGAAHEHRAREELQAALQRGGSVDQNELREAIEAARRAESMRSSLLAENAHLAAELEKLRGGQGSDTVGLAEEIDRLRAKLAEAEAGAAHEHRVREELEAALQRGASLGQHDLRDALEAAQRAEAARNGLVVENARLVAELERVRSGEGGHAGSAPDLLAEIDRLRARLAESQAGAAYEHRAREELEATLQRDATATLSELQGARETARHAQAAHAHISSEHTRTQAELDWARHEVERIEPLRTALSQAEQERAQLTAALEQARAERETERRSFATRQAATAAETATAMERLQAKLAESEELIARERRAYEVQVQAAGDAVAQDHLVRDAREHAAAAEASRDSAMLELTVARGTLSRAESALQAAQQDAAQAYEELNRLRAEDVALRGEKGHIAYDLEALRAREQELGARLSDRVREVEVLEQERAAEAAKVEQAAVEADRLRQTIAQLEMERGRLSAEVEGSAAARAQLEDALQQGLADARGRDQDLVTQLAERARELEALRVDRAADATRVEQLGADAERLRQSLAELELERGRLTAEVEGAAAARARLETALEEGLAEARAREQDGAARLTERERELDTLRTDRVADAERVGQLGAEADRLRQSVTDLEAERGRLAAEVEGAAAARARLEESLEQGLAQARAREQELEARIAAREQELETRLAAREQELEASVKEREQVLEALAAEAVAAEESAGGAASRDGEPSDAEVQAALAALGAGPMPAAQAEAPAATPTAPPPESATSPAATAAPSAPSVPKAPADTPRAAPAPAAAAGDAALTVVLEANLRWDKSAGPKQKIVCVPINDDTQRRLTEIEPARVLANLTNPKALAALGALRAAGSRATFFGCIADASAGRGLMLGVVEPAARPLDPNAVLPHLEQYGTKGKRVLTIGDDVDAFISLRQALTRSGMSVSMAWNGKQAIELMPMVRPHLVVLDLALAAADAAPVLALVASSTPNPITVLLPGPKDGAPTFVKALEGAGQPSTLSQLLLQLREPDKT